MIVCSNVHLLYVGKKVKRIFMPVPMASFRNVRKLNNYLDRAKLCVIELGTFFSSKEDSVRQI